MESDIIPTLPLYDCGSCTYDETGRLASPFSNPCSCEATNFIPRILDVACSLPSSVRLVVYLKYWMESQFSFGSTCTASNLLISARAILHWTSTRWLEITPGIVVKAPVHDTSPINVVLAIFPRESSSFVGKNQCTLAYLHERRPKLADHIGELPNRICVHDLEPSMALEGFSNPIMVEILVITCMA